MLLNALSARLGGGQTYVTNLLTFLPENVSSDIYVLAPDSLVLPTDRNNIRRLRICGPVENPITRAAWERIYLPRILREIDADILFCPGGIIGADVPPNCKSVTMFRNMIPFDQVQRRKYPFGFMRARNWLLKREMLQSMVKADCVICISEFARQVLEKNSPGLSRKTVVIPHGINPLFRSAQLIRPEWLPANNYVLYVSMLDVYKAQMEVVRAWSMLKRRRVTREKLILVGPERSDYAQKVRDEIVRLDLSEDVLITGPVPYDRLPSFYQYARINIFASECENCPNIMLEALAAGRPLLASNRPPMPEFAGDAAIYFDPSAPEDLADKLLSVIDSSARLRELSAKAKERSQLYDWANTARATWSVISQIAAENTINSN